MSMLEWNDSLSVKVPDIDEQHKSLVNMVNTLYDAMKDKADGTILLGIVNDMRQYTEVHFSTEERYMERYADPEFVRHKAEHVDFIAKVNQVESDCKSGKCSLSMDILNFLSSWLVTHINGTDKKMGAFLVKQGLVA